MSPEKPVFVEAPRPERKSVMFLAYKEGKFLLENRTNPEKSYYGYTIIPGGKCDLGLDVNTGAAMERELDEEWGLRPGNVTLLDCFECITTKLKHYYVEAYLILDPQGTFENREGKSEPIWVAYEQARNLLRFDNSRHVLELAQRFIEALARKD